MKAVRANERALCVVVWYQMTLVEATLSHIRTAVSATTGKKWLSVSVWFWIGHRLTRARTEYIAVSTLRPLMTNGRFAPETTTIGLAAEILINTELGAYCTE